MEGTPSSSFASSAFPTKSRSSVESDGPSVSKEWKSLRKRKPTQPQMNHPEVGNEVQLLDRQSHQFELISLYAFRHLMNATGNIGQPGVIDVYIDPSKGQEFYIREEVYHSIKCGNFKAIEQLIWAERVIPLQSLGQIILEMVVQWDAAYNDPIFKIGEMAENTKWKAVSEKRMDFLRHLFEMTGPELNVNVKDYNGTSLLMYALHDKNLEVIELLLENKADIDAQTTDNGSSALMIAIKRKLNKCVDFLIKKNANLDLQDKLGKTAMMWSVKELDDTTVIKTFIDKDANIKLVDNEGKNILMYVAETSHVALIKCIIERGIDVNGRDIEGNTALMYAAKANQKACLDQLYHLKADPAMKNNKGESLKSILDILENKVVMWSGIAVSPGPKAEYWTSAFFKAIENGDSREVEKLIKMKEFNKHNLPELFGETALKKALKSGHMDCAKVLLRNGYDVNDPGSYGKTPLEWAISANDTNSIEFLLKNGADANLNGKEYKKQIEEKRKKEKHGNVWYLARLNLNTTEASNSGDEGYTSLEFDYNESPLCTVLSAQEDQETLKVLELLLKYKADPDKEDNFKQTPLIKTMNMNKYKFMDLLLKYKADPNKKDEFGHTALILAAIDGDDKALQILLDYNADIGVKDSDGHIALDHAKVDRTKRCEEILKNWEEKKKLTEFKPEKIADAFDDSDTDFLLSIPEVASFGEEYSISSKTTMLKIKLGDHQEEIKEKIEKRLGDKYDFVFETSKESELELGSWARGFVGGCEFSESRGTLGCFVKSNKKPEETYYALTNKHVVPDIGEDGWVYAHPEEKERLLLGKLKYYIDIENEQVKGRYDIAMIEVSSNVIGYSLKPKSHTCKCKISQAEKTFVKKIGYCSKKTRGQIISTNYNKRRCEYRSETKTLVKSYPFLNVIKIIGVDESGKPIEIKASQENKEYDFQIEPGKDGDFFQSGDSGSVIVAEEYNNASNDVNQVNNVVGMLFASGEDEYEGKKVRVAFGFSLQKALDKIKELYKINCDFEIACQGELCGSQSDK